MEGMKEITLTDGTVICVQRVGQMYLKDAVQATDDPPQPPIEEVETATGVQRLENPSHPDYLRRLQEFEANSRVYSMRVILAAGLVLDLTPEQEKQVDRMIRRLKKSAAWVQEDPDFRKVAYLEYVIGLQEADYAILAQEIVAISAPSEDGVRSAMARFRGDVPGNRHLEMAGA